MVPFISRRYPIAPSQFPLFSAPFRLLNSALLICGAVAIGSVCAPEFVERSIPGWRSEYGLLIVAGVALGLIRSVWRLLFPILGLAFWIIAVLCLWRPSLDGLSLPSFIHKSVKGESVVASSETASTQAHGSLAPALPNGAYFPNRGGGTTGSSGLGGAFERFVRRNLRS